jgi:hypothetical protein
MSAFSTICASSRSSASSRRRISSSSKNVESEALQESSSIFDVQSKRRSRTTFPVHISSIWSSGVRFTCVWTPQTTAGATSFSRAQSLANSSWNKLEKRRLLRVPRRAAGFHLKRSIDNSICPSTLSCCLPPAPDPKSLHDAKKSR